MTTIYLHAWAFRFRRPSIDAELRRCWRDGWQFAFRYYYTDD